MYLQTSNCDDLFLSLFKANSPRGNQLVLLLLIYYYYYLLKKILRNVTVTRTLVLKTAH